MTVDLPATFPFSLERIEAFGARPDPWIRVWCPTCGQRPWGPCFVLPLPRGRAPEALFQSAPHPERLVLLDTLRLPPLVRERALCEREVARFRAPDGRLQRAAVYAEWWIDRVLTFRERRSPGMVDALPGFKVAGRLQHAGFGGPRVPLAWPTVDFEDAIGELAKWQAQIGKTFFGCGRLVEVQFVLPQEAPDLGWVMTSVSAREAAHIRRILRGGGFPWLSRAGRIAPRPRTWWTLVGLDASRSSRHRGGRPESLVSR